MYLLQLFDWYAASISIILICLCEIMIVGWIYGAENFVRDIEFMIGHRVERCWLICWKYITPSILSVRSRKFVIFNPRTCFELIFIVRSNIFQFIFVTTILFNTEVTYDGRQYPRWLIAIGWGSCVTSIICIPIYFVYKLSKMNGSLKKVLQLLESLLEFKCKKLVLTFKCYSIIWMVFSILANTNCIKTKQLGTGWWKGAQSLGRDDSKCWAALRCLMINYCIFYLSILTIYLFSLCIFFHCRNILPKKKASYLWRAITKTEFCSIYFKLVVLKSNQT